MQLQDSHGITEELCYLHVFVFQEDFHKVEEIVYSTFVGSEYRKILLTLQQREWLFDKANYCSFNSIGKKETKYHNLSDWKIYSCIASRDGHTYVMPFHNRGDIDVYFGDELKDISKFTQKQIFYFWREHETWGYEIFQQGKAVKSIVEDTHGPRVVVDGQEVFCGITKEGVPRVGKQFIDGKPIEFREIKEEACTKYQYNYSYPFKNEPKFFPESVFGYLENTLTKNQDYVLNPQDKTVILLHRNIVNVDDYINEFNKLLKSNKTGCGIFFCAILFLIAGIIVSIALLKGK